MPGSNEPSPYKEMGIHGNEAWRQTKRRAMRATSPHQTGVVFGHIWDVNYKWKSALEFCKSCGGPRFSVEGTKCLGSRKRRREASCSRSSQSPSF